MRKPESATGRRSERRRAEILDAALTLFAERGYDGTSLRDLARALGQNEASVYYYFASKDALYAAAIEEHTFRIPAGGAPRGGGTAAAEAYLRQIGEVFLARLAEHRRVTAILVAEAVRPAAARHPAAARFLTEIGARPARLAREIAATLGERPAARHRMAARQFLNGVVGAWAVEGGFGAAPWPPTERAAYVGALARGVVQGILSAAPSDAS